MAEVVKHECARCHKMEAYPRYAFCGVCRQQLNDLGICARCGV